MSPLKVAVGTLVPGRIFRTLLTQKRGTVLTSHQDSVHVRLQGEADDRALAYGVVVEVIK